MCTKKTTRLALLLACLSLALTVPACWDARLQPVLLPNIAIVGPDGGELLIRLAQITDSHITDTASPGRATVFESIVTEAWRPHELYAAQLLDGMIRSINRYHREVGQIHVLLHTGDAVDNAQLNELRWFLGVMDGEMVLPLSCIDDRDPADLPPPLLDPYHAFQAEGVYTQDRHGPLPTIPWYTLVGNHDVYAIGNFAVFETLTGRRVAPLPLQSRLGIMLPDVLIPDGSLSYGPISPANPGPPKLLNFPVSVGAVPERMFVTRSEITAEHFASSTVPIGHGFVGAGSTTTWYSAEIAANVRLIGLDTSDVPMPLPGVPYFGAAISPEQLDWFKAELAAAEERGEWVIVASHHPSNSLMLLYGSAISSDGFHKLLNGYSNVVLHVAGHAHVNRVLDWGGYVEIVTGSTLDYPQTGRIIEIHDAGDEIVINYQPISHLDSDDPLLEMRRLAAEVAAADVGRTAKRITQDATSAPAKATGTAKWLAGTADDQRGVIRLPKP